MYQRIQLAVLALLAAGFGLAVLARRSPNVGWLQAFRDAFPPLTHEQRSMLCIALGVIGIWKSRSR